MVSVESPDVPARWQCPVAGDESPVKQGTWQEEQEVEGGKPGEERECVSCPWILVFEQGDLAIRVQ